MAGGVHDNIRLCLKGGSEEQRLKVLRGMCRDAREMEAEVQDASSRHFTT